MVTRVKYITGLDALGSSISCGVVYHNILVFLSHWLYRQQLWQIFSVFGYCIDRRASIVIVMVAMLEATLLAVAIVVGTIVAVIVAVMVAVVIVAVVIVADTVWSW